MTAIFRLWQPMRAGVCGSATSIEASIWWRLKVDTSTHVEDQHVFCVNRIFPDAKTGTIDVATANGLVRFDKRGR